MFKGKQADKLSFRFQKQKHLLGYASSHSNLNKTGSGVLWFSSVTWFFIVWFTCTPTINFVIGLVCLFKICVSFSSWLVLVALYPAVLFLFLKCWSAVRLAVHSAWTTDFLAFIYNSSLHPFTSNELLLPSSSTSVLQCPGFTSDACHHGSTLDSTSFGCVSVNRRPDSCSQASPCLLPPSTPVWVSVLVILFCYS